jgi:GTPase SAR1 family protein
MLPMYIRNVHVCIISAAIDNEKSLNNINMWLPRLDDDGESPQTIIAINKIDFEQCLLC